jgi:hypothetical protein
MPKGYQLVELDEMQPLACQKHYHQTEILLLKWLAQRIREHLGTQVAALDIDAICINFYGSEYPGYGLHYRGQPPGSADPVYGDLAPAVEACAAELLRTLPVMDFLNYLTETECKPTYDE